ncbi:MAG TPA: 2-C-methyl-D-erythritol 2,4-cyclodiphosphate synthase [Gemmatimonadota bacterium]|nr:2-C-methyl-D-erythritol 2,4-cyclodiphosphate synthase [Gemmatimonadota bacterium]
MRAGTGYDSHRFTGTRPLVLGGVTIPDAPGLAGHSDGDAVLHALIDALLGATALGSIGLMFPDTDANLAGIDSTVLLSRVVERLAEDDWRVVNADITVIAERPRIQPHAEAMRERISGLLGVPGTSVSVKGKTNEGMGWVGRGEGLAVMAVALVDRAAD